MLSRNQKLKLLELARKSIRSFLSGKPVPKIEAKDEKLMSPRGVFVSLHEKGLLRGCIGCIEPIRPLIEQVQSMAVSSATEDPRFLQLKPEDLVNVNIEISVLSPLQKIRDIEDIRMGMHGVMIKKGYRSGVFLPQVAIEAGWDRETFLNNLCEQKAGLKERAWEDLSCEVFIFTCETFCEKSLGERL